MLRFLFGDDIFISYSRGDGANYAAALANELSKPSPGPGFSCFLDHWGASSGTDLSKPVIRALRRSSVFVLVGTRGVLDSKYVKLEVEEFSRPGILHGHRPILPINIDGALNEVKWEKLKGLGPTKDTETARVEGIPSAAVIRLIANSGTYTKRNQRVRWLSIGALLLFLASIGATVTAWQQNRRAEKESKNATQSARIADEKTKFAADKQSEAEKSAKLAETKQREADRNATLAEQRKDQAMKAEAAAKASASAAQASARAADAQTRLAQQNARVAKSQEIASLAMVQRNVNSDLSLALVSEAIAVAPTAHAVESLRSILLEVPTVAVLRIPDTEIVHVAYSPDGKLVITSGSRGLIRIWDVATQQVIREFVGGSTYIQEAVFSPDQKWVLATEDHGARIWSVTTGQIVRELKSKDGETVSSAAVSKDGSRVAIRSSGHLTVWDTATGRVVREIEVGKIQARGVAFSPDGAFVATATTGHIVNVFRIDSGEVAAELKGHTAPVASVKYSSDGQFILTSSMDKTARIWESKTGETIDTLDEPHRDYVRDASFSPDGTVVVTCSGSSVHIWPFQYMYQRGTAMQVAELRGHRAAARSAGFSPDGRFIVSAGADGTARIWPLGALPDVRELRWHEQPVRDAAFNPAGGELATASADVTGVWFLPRSYDWYHPKIESPSYMKAGAVRVAYSPDGRTIITGGSDGTIRVWGGEDYKEGHEFKAATEGITAVTYSPNGQLIAASSSDGTAKLWRASDYEPIGSLQAATSYNDTVRSIAFSPDGRFVITAADAGDGDRRGTVRIWNTETRVMSGELPEHGDHVNSAVYSPDGEFILTACGDGKVRIWRAVTPEVVRVIEDDFKGIEVNAAYSPDGKLIVTAGGLKPAKVWDAATGHFIAELGGSAADRAAFSRDGEWIVTMGDKTTWWPRLSFMPVEELRERLRTQAPPELTYGQRKEHLRETRQ